jgi:imidazole glycerol-phosphate synthase subunit HisH
LRKRIAVINYGNGNIQSIQNALNKFDVEVVLTHKKHEILSADGVILPGVGAYKKAMNALIDRGLDKSIKEFLKTNKPFLGVCLGMQLLFDSSNEFGLTKGLSILQGEVIKFPVDQGTKLPHISWNSIKRYKVLWQDTILNSLNDNEVFYFVHSYICVPKKMNNILAISEYGGVEFCAAVKEKNIYGCQFHPEKSSKLGLKIISNFVDLVVQSK